MGDHLIAKFEWAIIEVIVLALLVAELVSVRRSIARDRKKAERSGE